MIVGELLELDGLDIEVAWATRELLEREVTGVTSTDLQDPARYLQAGELVLTGLVWWHGEDASAALRFANALRSAEVSALLAGEGTHGTVPEELVAACRAHSIALLSVPAGTSFRAVTDRVYLRLWGELRERSENLAAVPATVRRELLGMLHSHAPAAAILAHAVAHLGLPHCRLETAGGRVLASSAPDCPVPEGPPIAVGPAGTSPFDGWRLRPVAQAAPAATTVLHGLAELLGPLATRARATATAQRQSAVRVLESLARGGGPGLAEALAACGLPGRPVTPVLARIEGAPESWAAAALAEGLHVLGVPFAAAPDGQGGAVALVAGEPAAVEGALRAAWPGLAAVLTDRQELRGGVGPTAGPDGATLRGALVEAGYALASAGPGEVGSSGELTSLQALLRGIPTEVKAAYRSSLLAPLAEHDRTNPVSLLGTLDSFLRHDASWSRTAEALHIHVNTVHYRIKRIEELTGRSLVRLEDRLDLRAALLCPTG
ncbi:transcriptional regulator, PucR family protein [Streptomyces tateyamensis]|uniref:Transcriptional regulator, PucR family protein n=1 Tax=Streptomyces tateyamensis TaxID=565073 RepID=A0A2V4NUF2_9ACTN|nr:PucR family transcriptional regulator [Streptomyces tateyamensis]PYC87356.1 transcriptional regulator, PucR family protein [Streptomyces tateyamensis]